MPQSQISLLIIDDNPELRDSLSAIFSHLGYGVRLAEDGFSALVQIRSEVPDVVLSDLNMPGMSGFELLSVLRRRLPGLRVVAMSGMFSQDGVQPGVAADAFYEKGTKLSVLLHLVATKNAGVRPSGFQEPTPATPIWISAELQDGSVPPSVVITCPDCLRTFPHAECDSGSFICTVSCSYCQSSISFGIVHSLDPAQPMGIQQKSAPRAAAA